LAQRSIILSSWAYMTMFQSVLPQVFPSFLSFSHINE
jgi:hypothetical protein